MIRSSKIFPLLISGLLLGSGLLAAAQQARALGQPWELVLPIAGGVAAGLIFQPLNRLLRRWIDRFFFKSGPQTVEVPGHLEYEFLVKISHDLRTPVTCLGWSVRNLRDGLAGEVNPRQFEYLEGMNRAVKQLDGLVDSLPVIRKVEREGVSHGT